MAGRNTAEYSTREAVEDRFERVTGLSEQVAEVLTDLKNGVELSADDRELLRGAADDISRAGRVDLENNFQYGYERFYEDPAREAVVVLHELAQGNANYGRQLYGEDNEVVVWGRALDAVAEGFWESYDRPEVRALAGELRDKGVEHQADWPGGEDVRLSLAQLEGALFSGEGLVVVARDETMMEQFVGDAAFLGRPEAAAVYGRVAASDVEGRNVFGVIPVELEAEAASVTRYDMRASMLQRAGKSEFGTYTGDQVAEMHSGLVTYQVREVALEASDIDLEQTTFVTRHPELVTHWRDEGLIGQEQVVHLLVDSPEDAAAVDQSRLDAYTYVLSRRDENGELRDWSADVGAGELVAHGHVGHADVDDLVSDKTVVGILPPYLRDAAASVVTYSFDRDTGGYGPGRQFETTVLARTDL